MQTRCSIQATGQNNGDKLRNYPKSSNRSENRPLIYYGQTTYHYYAKDHLGNNRAVINHNTGAIEQVTHYYPFGAVYGDVGTNDALQRYKYNGKELDRMHGLNQYDYGARNYDPLMCRFTQLDPLADKDYPTSPYVYCANNPINAIDLDGNLTIFINGFHWGWEGASSSYWGGFDNKVINHFQEKRAPLYYDGSLGGPSGLIPMTLGNQVSLNFHTEKHRNSSLLSMSRYNMGYKEGERNAITIFSALSRNGDGIINEVIRIISHSMGGAFAKGYAQALMDYIFEHPDLTNGASIVEYDFAPYQPQDQKAVKGVDTYQYSHIHDKIAGNKKIEGANYMKTSNDEEQRHRIKYFWQYVNQLPEGRYRVVNGQIVKM